MSEKPEEIAKGRMPTVAIAALLAADFFQHWEALHPEAAINNASRLIELIRVALEDERAASATAIKEAEARAYERAAKVADSVVALVGSPAFVFVPTTADGVRATAKDIAEGIRALSNPESANRENGK